jgi:NADH-quinone oxidoreductase subunit H
MHFGWKRLIPISLLWTIAVAAIRTINLNGGFNRHELYIAIGILVALIIVLLFFDDRRAVAEPEAEDEEPFDAFAGGYPVPPQASARPAAAAVAQLETEGGAA